jgi:hypothetical protein
MSSIEDELRELFADPRRHPAPWPDATTRVRSGMRRRHRRRVAGTAGSVTLALLVAIAVAAAWVRPVAPPPPGPPAPTPTPSAVAWSDLPSAPYPPAALDPRPSTVECATRDLALSPVLPGAAMGTEYYLVEVRNTGPAPCTLSGQPTLRYTDANGATRTGQTQEMTSLVQDPNAVPATINPGETARLQLKTATYCSANQDGAARVRWNNARLVMADGGTLPLGVSLTADCGVGMSPWSRPDPGSSADPAWGNLIVSLELPTTVQIGQAMEYTVTLANPTDVAVPLSPCPNYLQDLTMVKAGGYSRLNCVVSEIPPRDEVRFAMRLLVPDYVTTTGPVTLNWELETDRADATPKASGTITLVR